MLFFLGVALMWWVLLFYRSILFCYGTWAVCIFRGLPGMTSLAGLGVVLFGSCFDVVGSVVFSVLVCFREVAFDVVGMLYMRINVKHLSYNQFTSQKSR